MSMITRSVLSLMALMMMTVGVSFAEGSGACCNGGACDPANCPCHQK
jgi:hypothetical protein